MAIPAPRYGWYGDDFTGATDTLATLAERGRRALLFLGLPTPGQLAAAGPLDAIGIAGATRTLAPPDMARELEAAGRFFAAAGVALLHYKCCSTFDSAPQVGSIGAAVAALRGFFPNPLIPIVGGQPNLGRYCLFGQLFAAAGDGTVHRIDRHPTMSRHPVTPMTEADLRLHLGAQGLAPVVLVDYRAHEAPDGLAGLPDEAGAVLFDVAREADLAAIGRLVASRLDAGPMLAVGPSSVARALAAAEATSSDARAPSPPPRAKGPVLALVGSLSPVTRAQVEAAHGYARIAVDPGRLLSDAAHGRHLRSEAIAALARGNAILVTDRPDGPPVEAGAVATATGRLLAAVMEEARPARLVVAGGDTSTMAVRALPIWGLSYRAACVPGAPLCRAHADHPWLDRLEIILKGGQMGPRDFFAAVGQ
ncbi:four-carbon acid sugar kinase family protein [Ancylobacter oerskovii]|uniref:Four-carbon acid sugar kinase family protein n=1 Tax=Ancylobacter oerskovii TaxID=459519 RepID=A0ABW4YZK8_9HYPH|nr:four-carbon acid sugar kinase family protein [Ancylobacter oerskovii]